MKPYVLIVDAFSSGVALAAEWKKRGFSCIHVQSSSDIAKILISGYHPEDFDVSLLHKDFNSTKSWCQKFSPKFVMTGAETGVELADQLTETFGLPGNGTELSHVRRNKYLILDRLRRCGLDTGHFEIVNTGQEALEKWRSIGETVVIKPLRSAGKDFVTVCHNGTEVERAVARIIEQKTTLGREQNSACLIMEFIEGQEFAVNTVSYDGKCFITDAWKYKRREANGVKVLFDYAEYIFDPTFQDFATKVTDALGIRFGPAHIELILGPNGPRVVDIGVRLCGAGLPLFLRKCGIVDPVALAVGSYLNPKGKPLSPKKVSLENIRVAFLINLFEGRIAGFRADEKIRHLNSTVEVKWNLRVGDSAHLTRDSYTVAGSVWMKNNNFIDLEADYGCIKRFEKEGLFDFCK